MKMIKKTLVALSLSVCGLGAVADNTWYPNDAWSNKKNTAIFTASMWSSEDGGTVCPAIRETDDFIVTGATIRFQSVSFGGNSLTLRNATMVFDGGSGNQFPRDGLILEEGIFYNNVSSTSEDPLTTYFYEIGGNVTVRSTGESPFAFQSSQYNDKGTVFTGALAGDSTVVMKVSNQYGIGSNSRMNVRYVFLNAAAYNGRVNVATYGTTSFAGLETASGFYLGSTTLPGTVAVSKGATFGAYRGTDACSVGTLSLARGSRIAVAYDENAGTNGSIAVNTAFSITGTSADGVVDIFFQKAKLDKPAKYPVLSVPTGVELDENDFGLTLVDDMYGPHSATLRVEPNEQGGQTLFVVANGAYLLMSDNTTYKTAGAVYSSAFTNAASWSDGAIPHAGPDYFVGAGMTFREIDDIALDYVFPARKLTILGGDSESVLICGGRSLEVTNFVVGAGASFGLRSVVSNGPRITGDAFELQDGASLKFYGYANALSVISSEVKGPGSMETAGISATSSAKGFLELTGLNTNWSGRLTVNYATSAERGYPGDGNGSYTLYVSDERNLGGTLDMPDFRALTLTGWSRFVPRNSLALAPDFNRGIYVKDNGSFNVPEDIVLSCNRTLTVDGAVYKEGKGTLVLGGALKFYDAVNDAATDEVPVGAENRLVLREGTLKVGAAKACDGLPIHVMNLSKKTTAIRIPVDAEPGSDLARYGLYNVKAGATPFVLDDGLTTLPIAFDGQALFPSDETGVRTNALVTVDNSAVESVRAMLPKVARPYSNVRAAWVEIPVAGENATTFAALSERKGIVILFR